MSIIKECRYSKFIFEQNSNYKLMNNESASEPQYTIRDAEGFNCGYLESFRDDSWKDGIGYNKKTIKIPKYSERFFKNYPNTTIHIYDTDGWFYLSIDLLDFKDTTEIPFKPDYIKKNHFNMSDIESTDLLKSSLYEKLKAGIVDDYVVKSITLFIEVKINGVYQLIEEKKLGIDSDYIKHLYEVMSKHPTSVYNSQDKEISEALKLRFNSFISFQDCIQVVKGLNSVGKFINHVIMNDDLTDTYYKMYPNRVCGWDSFVIETLYCDYIETYNNEGLSEVRIRDEFLKNIEDINFYIFTSDFI